MPGRLEQPLRVALAGSLKAGKSTLLNSLVGQDIAPTDATECTRVVTWYRNGSTPTVTAVPAGQRCGAQRSATSRCCAGTDISRSTSATSPPTRWTASTSSGRRPPWLDTTIIDTPGTSSLSRDVSARTLEMLTPDNEASGADAVVYLLRTLNATDVQFLGQIGDHVGDESGPLGVVGVVSRADEVGAGRLDAMMSAKEVASRFAGELERTGLCQAVVPVAGLLALGARTMRQAEFAAFQHLAEVPVDDLNLAMLSADRFAREDSPLPGGRRDARSAGRPLRALRDPDGRHSDPVGHQGLAHAGRANWWNAAASTNCVR